MPLNVVKTTGDDVLARVFIAELNDGSLIEFVESVQPPLSREEKWVLIISTSKGCPVGCPICDAGGNYKGKLSKEELIGQIDYMVKRRFPDGRVPVPKFKIQFARMGDSAFNNNVLNVLEQLPSLFDAPGLLPSISTVAPANCLPFLQKLTTIKNELYSNGNFQMQFSVHSTNDVDKRKLIPIKTLTLKEISEFGDTFFKAGDRKISLNFAAVKGMELSAKKIAQQFSPKRFMIKLTPVNPTGASKKAGLQGLIDPENKQQCEKIVKEFTSYGFETILSIGDLRENAIGSNCGMYVANMSLDKHL